MKMTMNMQKDEKSEEEDNNKENKKESTEDIMKSTTKSMSYMMPVMAFSISLVAPLGLALYWLMSNVLMIVEKLVINKYVDSKEDKKDA